MRRPLTLILLAACLMSAAALPAAAEERPTTPFVQLGPLVLHGSEADALMLGLGVFDPFDNRTSAAATLEYRLGRKLLFIGPAIGGMANSEGGLFGYFGLYFDLSVGPIYFTPQLGLAFLPSRATAETSAATSSSARSLELSYRFAMASAPG